MDAPKGCLVPAHGALFPMVWHSRAPLWVLLPILPSLLPGN